MEFQMPFELFTLRSFTHISMRANVPNALGIYGISNAREWIYIQETDSIRASLLHLLKQNDSTVLKRYTAGSVFELRDPTERLAGHNRLIPVYEPVCNRRLLENETGRTT
jgi:hypothetical protein